MPNTTKRPTRKGERGTTKHSASDADRLSTYRAKRRFDVTPEPAPESSQAPEAAEKKTAPTSSEPQLRPSYVVHKHDARRLHYDVRLEIDGALASWAVPRGPSYDPAVRRLAVQTEDHPMMYGTFEGRIPDGEYGAGDILLWDRGTYETIPPGQQRAQSDSGHLRLRMFGEKLQGEWHLVKTGRRGGDDGAGGSGKSQWLFFKGKDALANPAYDVVAEKPESVASGRVATRGPRRVGASEQGKSARALLEAVGEPALATAVTHITEPGQWLYEVKYDGYRLCACKAGTDVRLYTRRANDWTDRFKPIAQAVARLRVRECVIDGEACAVGDSGKPSFGALQEWLGGQSKDIALGYAAFDLLWMDGRDLRGEPLEVRRELLEKLLEGQGAPLSYSRSLDGDVRDLLRVTKEAGLEGLVAKRKGSTYIGGRTTQWLKLRFERRQDCAIVGWLPLKGTRDMVGSLVVAVVGGGKLVYAGRVGTGFDDRTRKELAKRLAGDDVKEPPVDVSGAVHMWGGQDIKLARWVEPKVVCQCNFTEWTRDGSMRAPTYEGLRPDKAPMDCTRETDGDREPTTPQTTTWEKTPKAERPRLANPDKVLFPRDAIRKQDIWDYYTAVAPVMLPHLAGRPLTLQRWPNGIDGEEWYQQNIEKVPSFVRLVDVGPRHDNKKRVVADNLETLQWLANLAALTLHQWCAHVPPGATTREAIDRALARPDYVVLDLDPGDGPWSHLVEVARAVRALLEALSLESAVKTSGKRGLHIVVPIGPGPTHERATGFAEQIARAVAKVLPKISTVERMKDKRGGKLYVDFGQNGEGRTIVAPYTIRARDGAVVSTPITWDEVTDDLDISKFTTRTVLRRVEKLGDLFERAIRGKQSLPA
jgi:bifunctional non-homologous end joining protein LigD